MKFIFIILSNDLFLVLNIAIHAENNSFKLYSVQTITFYHAIFKLQASCFEDIYIFLLGKKDTNADYENDFCFEFFFFFSLISINIC